MGGRPLNSALDVMRLSIAILVAMTSSGCASTPNVFPDYPDVSVTVRFIDPHNAHGYPFANGIYSIDSTVFEGSQRALVVSLAPGKHSIGVNCASFLPVDQVPRKTFDFAPGFDYELYCDLDPEIRQVPKPARE